MGSMNNRKDTHHPSAQYQEMVGDIMRGQRASMGKSLLDVQNDIGLRPYISMAIENGDLKSFSTPSLIAGYVRQYAKYLNMAPEETYHAFCEQTGHSGQVRSTPKYNSSQRQDTQTGLHFTGGHWAETHSPLFRHLLGKISLIGVVSVCLLVVLLAGGGYVSWTLYEHIKKLPIADNTLKIAGQIQSWDDDTQLSESLVNDSPVASRDLNDLEVIGNLAPEPVTDDLAALDTSGLEPQPYETQFDFTDPFVFEEGDRGDLSFELANGGLELLTLIEGFQLSNSVVPVETGSVQETGLVLYPVEPSWVRITDSNGKVYIEKILNKGETYSVPEGEQDLFLRAGNSGYLYFVIGEEVFGPAGSGTKVVKQVLLQNESIIQNYADRKVDQDLDRFNTLN